MESTTEPAVPYIAVLLYVSSSDAADYPPLYSEDVVLLYARSPAHAEEKAQRLGEDRRTTYRNDRGESITWRLLRVADVAPALDDRLTEDAELYSRHFTDLAAYERFDTSAADRPA